MNMDPEAKARIDSLEAEVAELEQHKATLEQELFDMTVERDAAVGQLRILRFDRRYEVA